jgi:DNA-binding transcriptional regulator GbsR (MarR family)
MEAMTQAKPLSELSRQFVSHFGEMGSRWGINRTVGQIYALLFISPEPLNADQIADTLEFSRSNVSMGLKELQAWRLVQLRHQPGDRREYFQAPEDVWEIFKRLAEERRRREIAHAIHAACCHDGRSQHRRRTLRPAAHARYARTHRQADELV